MLQHFTKLTKWKYIFNIHIQKIKTSISKFIKVQSHYILYQSKYFFFPNHIHHCLIKIIKIISIVQVNEVIVFIILQNHFIIDIFLEMSIFMYIHYLLWFFNFNNFFFTFLFGIQISWTYKNNNKKKNIVKIKILFIIQKRKF